MNKIIYNLIATVILLNLLSCTSKKYGFRTKVSVSPNETITIQKIKKTPLTKITEVVKKPNQINSGIAISSQEFISENTITPSTEIHFSPKNNLVTTLEKNDANTLKNPKTPKKDEKPIENRKYDDFAIIGLSMSIFGYLIQGIGLTLWGDVTEFSVYIMLIGALISFIGLIRTFQLNKKGKLLAIAGVIIGLIPLFFLIYLILVYPKYI